MAYVTREELERRFGAEEIAQLIDVESGDADDVIADASALVDGYLGSLYQLPLSEPAPALVVSLVADVARYRLWDDRAPSEVRRRYEDAIATLKDIAKGAIKLPAAPGATPTVENLGIIASTSRCRTFTDCTLSSFVGHGGVDWPPRTD